jgi:hypothetical protein
MRHTITDEVPPELQQRYPTQGHARGYLHRGPHKGELGPLTKDHVFSGKFDPIG